MAFALRSSTSVRAFGPAQSSTRARAAVVVRVKPTSAADFRSLSAEEILKRAGELKAEYTKLQYMKRTRGKVQNPETMQDQADDSAQPKGNEYKHVRRQLAQLLTVLREKQAADGIGRKEARMLKKEASVGAGFGGK
ncbi:MAG: mitochondrial ribosomal protein L29 [Monoraphidium minutum]|nr:MAG: mitochondrial ribosomal protein L29 [Monoraphidium minutum]